MSKLPKNLQGFLWSVDINNLDTTEDKVYIINQILAYGGLPELKWLFKTYSLKQIKDVFLHSPVKTYRPSAFNFAQKILLSIRENLDERKYVVNTPRIIR